jgi:cytochrome P450
MASYVDADLPQMYPGMAPTIAFARAHLSDARKNAGLAKGVFGPLVLRHEDVTALLRDRRLRGPGMDLARLSGIPEGGRAWKRQAQILLFMEGEDHHRLRRLVAKAFTPRSVEALRPSTRATIRALIDSVVDHDECDAIPSLCNPFPIPVICALVGIEPDRIDDMSRWAGSILKSLRLDAGAFIDEMEAAQEEMDDYLSVLIEQRRVVPRNDLLSNLISVEEAGDRLSPSELLSVVSMMLVAGTDTTRNQLGCIINTFADNPDQWALLRERPELMASAVEEAIRWEPATEAIAAGSIVVLLSMSANHDTTALPGGDRFDIERENPEGWHLLTFGGGIHYCLGASLARLEMTEALAELSSRFPTLRHTGEPVPHPPGSPIFGYQSLPISWT